MQDDMVRDLDISVSQFMSFYAWYSWPNVILCFFGGFLIDRVLGVRVGAIVFSLFVTAGQVQKIFTLYLPYLIAVSSVLTTGETKWFQERVPVHPS